VKREATRGNQLHRHDGLLPRRREVERVGCVMRFEQEDEFSSSLYDRKQVRRRWFKVLKKLLVSILTPSI